MNLINQKFRYRLRLAGFNFLRRLSFFKKSKDKMPRHILIGGVVLLGDLILISPLFQALKKEFPQASIELLVPNGWAEFAKNFKDIDQVFEAKTNDSNWFKNFRKTHKNRWDLGIVPWAYHLIPLFYALGIKKIRSFPDPKNRRGYQIHQKINLPKIASHISRMTLSLCCDSEASKANYFSPHFDLEKIKNLKKLENLNSQNLKNPYVIIHPGASNPPKVWDLKNYALVADELKKMGYQVVLTGVGPEKNLTAQIAYQAPHCLDLAGKTKLHELLALISEASLVIGPDTGVLHLARAVKIPSIALMGPTQLEIYGPHPDFHEMSQSKVLYIPDLPCRDMKTMFKHEIAGLANCKRPECLYKDVKCVKPFQVSDVMKLMREIL